MDGATSSRAGGCEEEDGAASAAVWAAVLPRAAGAAACAPAAHVRLVYNSANVKSNCARYDECVARSSCRPELKQWQAEGW